MRLPRVGVISSLEKEVTVSHSAASVIEGVITYASALVFIAVCAVLMAPTRGRGTLTVYPDYSNGAQSY